MNQLHKNGILIMFNICFDIMYTLKQLAVWNALAMHKQAHF